MNYKQTEFDLGNNLGKPKPKPDNSTQSKSNIQQVKPVTKIKTNPDFDSSYCAQCDINGGWCSRHPKEEPFDPENNTREDIESSNRIADHEAEIEANKDIPLPPATDEEIRIIKKQILDEISKLP